VSWVPELSGQPIGRADGTDLLAVAVDRSAYLVLDQRQSAAPAQPACAESWWHVTSTEGALAGLFVLAGSAASTFRPGTPVTLLDLARMACCPHSGSGPRRHRAGGAPGRDQASPSAKRAYRMGHPRHAWTRVSPLNQEWSSGLRKRR
jgi:hypothetical protein